MRKGIITMMAAALGSLLLIGTAAGEHVPTGFNMIKLSAALTYGDEVPRPTPDAQRAVGSFAATAKWLGDGMAEFTWQLSFRDVTGPVTAAHIHVGAPGEAGPVAVPLCSPCTNGQRGLARMDVGVISSINHGRAYVNIHTAKNPAGEIRGQVTIWDKYAVTLRARQVTTPVRGNVSRARAGFTATIRANERTEARITWRLGWMGLTSRPVHVYIRVGQRGKVGRPIFFLCGNEKRPCIKNRSRTDRLSPAQAQALVAGDLYVILSTVRNPKGELRAQLRKAQLYLRVK